MNKYTIYCTEEQTRKALELGAPIRVSLEVGIASKPKELTNEINGFILPTAEQMIGWLEEQGIVINIQSINGVWTYSFVVNNMLSQVYISSTRTGATLKAIDAALDYLIKNKK